MEELTAFLDNRRLILALSFVTFSNLLNLEWLVLKCPSTGLKPYLASVRAIVLSLVKLSVEKDFPKNSRVSSQR